MRLVEKPKITRMKSVVPCFLAGLVLACSALGQEPVRIADPTKRLDFQGFSVLPPSGKDWFTVEPPPSEWDVLFFKSLGKTHSVYAGVKSFRRSGTETPEQLKSSFLAEAKRDPRVKLLKAETSLDKCLGHDCVRFDLMLEDHATRHFPGTGLMLTRQGFIVTHPVPGAYVWVEYSERFQPEAKRYPLLDAELEPFLEDLQFILSESDSFGDDCRWARGETESFAYGCEGGAYRMRLKKPGPVHVYRNFGWNVPAVSVETDVAVVSGRGSQPGEAFLGIGCLADQERGYVAVLKTDGGWGIMRLDSNFIQVAGGHRPREVPEVSLRNRLGIVCEWQSEKRASLVSFLVNGQKVGSVEDQKEYGPYKGVALYVDTFPGVVAFYRLVAREPPE